MHDYFKETKEIKKLKKVFEYLLAYHIGDKKHMEKLKDIIKLDMIKPNANSDSRDKWTFKLNGEMETGYQVSKIFELHNICTPPEFIDE